MYFVLVMKLLHCMFVWQVFKGPLECPTLRGGPILSPEDVKGIFGNIADIMDVHKRIQVRAVDFNIRMHMDIMQLLIRNP